MTDQQIQSASDLLWTLWHEGKRVPELPKTLAPATRAEAYAIQARLEARSARELFGWKIAATSQAGQAHIGVDGPIAGRLLAEHVYPDGAELALGTSYMCVAEAEFAFCMARDLPPRTLAYTVAQMLEAVATLHPAIEVPDSRFDDFSRVGAPQLIADNACAHAFILGPEAANWRAIDLSQHRATVTVAGKYEREGVGRNVLGDPRVALAWLANELSSHGITLKAGQVVTTGTCLPPLPVAPGDAVTADFGLLGKVTARFSR